MAPPAEGSAPEQRGRAEATHAGWSAPKGWHTRAHYIQGALLCHGKQRGVRNFSRRVGFANLDVSGCFSIFATSLLFMLLCCSLFDVFSEFHHVSTSCAALHCLTRCSNAFSFRRFTAVCVSEPAARRNFLLPPGDLPVIVLALIFHTHATLQFVDPSC